MLFEDYEKKLAKILASEKLKTDQAWERYNQANRITNSVLNELGDIRAVLNGTIRVDDELLARLKLSKKTIPLYCSTKNEEESQQVLTDNEEEEIIQSHKKWIGCGECDPAFSCYNGQNKCIDSSLLVPVNGKIVNGQWEGQPIANFPELQKQIKEGLADGTINFN